MARTELFVRKQPGGIFSVENNAPPFGTGERFYVHSVTGTDQTGSGKNPDNPVATLDYAVGLCTASKGDIIYLMPGQCYNVGQSPAKEFVIRVWNIWT